MIRSPQTASFRSCLMTILLTLAALPCLGQSSANLRILPLGDSITWGTESTTQNGYRGPLSIALSSQVSTQDFVGTGINGTMSDPDNEGHPSYKISDIAALTNASLNKYKPNIVLLDAGINDLGQNYEISSAPARLGSLVDQILAAEPDATVLVATLIINGDPNLESLRETFNSQLPTIIQARVGAGKHVALVDMGTLTTADLSGTLHPNDAGYQLMANAWDQAIQQVITNGWITDPLAGSATRPTGAIYSSIPGKCLDDATVSGSSTIKAVINDCSSSISQQWNLNSGQIVVNGKCLDIDAGRTTNGIPVDLYTCNGQTNQQWTIQNGTLINPASGRCLDDPASSTTNGTQLDIYDCSGNANQQWRVPSEGPVVSGMAGQVCLDSFGGITTNMNKVDVYGCNQTAAQQWKVTNNTLTFDGKCLDINNGVPSGTPPQVEVYTCNSGTNQVWVPVNGTLINPVSGMCLDIPGSNIGNGTQLDTSVCGGNSNQQWTLPPGTPIS